MMLPVSVSYLTSSFAWVVPHSHLIFRPEEDTPPPVPALSLFTHLTANGKLILPAMGSRATATGFLSQKSVARAGARGVVQDYKAGFQMGVLGSQRQHL